MFANVTLYFSLEMHICFCWKRWAQNDDEGSPNNFLQEINIYQEHLDSFLESAQRLEIYGLIGGNEESINFKDEEEDLLVGKNQAPVS